MIQCTFGVLVPLMLVFAAAGCADDDGSSATDEAAVEQIVRDVVAAWNSEDAGALTALFTDEGLASAFGDGDVPAEEIVAALPAFIGEPALAVRELDVHVSGNEATVETLWEAGRVLESVEFELVDEGDTWRISGQTDLPVEVPDGVEPVTIQMNEFAFAFIATDVTTETIAFVAANVGDQDHEIALARIPADTDVEELLMAEDDVPGFESIGGAGPAAPGEAVNLVLSEALEPGRYLLVCLLPDTDDPEETPHAFKGMTAEFTLAP